MNKITVGSRVRWKGQVWEVATLDNILGVATITREVAPGWWDFEVVMVEDLEGVRNE